MFREMPVWALENGRGIWLLLDSLALLPGVTDTVVREVQCKGVPQGRENNSRLEAVGACSRRNQKSSQSPPFGWVTHSWRWHQRQGVWKGRGRKCGHCPAVGDTSVYITSLIVCSLSQWFLPRAEVLRAIFKRATIFPVEEAKNTLWESNE